VTNQPRLGLVIGSGGLKCAAALGVLQVLEEQNIPLDMVVGCSGGAVFGGLMALGYSAGEIAEVNDRMWASGTAQKLNFRSLVKIAFPRLAGFDDEVGILDDRALTEGLVDVYGSEITFADTKIPFHCVATDFHTGEPVVMSDGNISRALRASAGIPVLFKPVERRGRWLIDGGLSNPLPIDVAIQEGERPWWNRYRRRQISHHRCSISWSISFYIGSSHFITLHITLRSLPLFRISKGR